MTILKAKKLQSKRFIAFMKIKDNTILKIQIIPINYLGSNNRIDQIYIKTYHYYCFKINWLK